MEDASEVDPVLERLGRCVYCPGEVREMWILHGRGEVDPVWERWRMPRRRELMSSVFFGAESWYEAEVIRR